MKDDAVSNVVGAILVFSIVGIAVVSINALYVPKEGATLEVAARESAEDALIASAALQGSASTPFVSQLPLSPNHGTPSLLPGIILDPVRADGVASMNATTTRINVSVVTHGTAPAGDPTRVDAGGGLMRVFLLGNATSAAPVGALKLRIGGAYLDSASYELSAGAVLLQRGANSSALAAPGLHVARGGTSAAPLTEVSWRVPVLAGGLQQVSGKGAAQARFTPGPVASAGGGDLVRNVTITVVTDAAQAWNATLHDIVGANGVVTATIAADGSGTVTATILPPSGAAANADAVRLDLSLERFVVELSARAAP